MQWWEGRYADRIKRSYLHSETFAEEGDAVREARGALRASLQAYLAMHGELYVAEKHAFTKLARLQNGESTLQRAHELASPGALSVRGYVSAVERFSRELGVGVSSQLPCTDIHDDTRPANRVRVFRIGRDSYLVREKAQIYQISPAAAKVWDSMTHGSQVRTTAAMETDTRREPRESREESILADFVRSGLIIKGPRSARQANRLTPAPRSRCRGQARGSWSADARCFGASRADEIALTPKRAPPYSLRVRPMCS